MHTQQSQVCLTLEPGVWPGSSAASPGSVLWLLLVSKTTCSAAETPPRPLALRSKPWSLRLAFEAPMPGPLRAVPTADWWLLRWSGSVSQLPTPGLPARPASHGYTCLSPSTFAQAVTLTWGALCSPLCLSTSSGLRAQPKHPLLQAALVSSAALAHLTPQPLPLRGLPPLPGLG